MDAPFLLRPPSDEVVDALFNQAVATGYKGEPYLQCMRRFTDLLTLELQHQVFERAYHRERNTEIRNRSPKRAMKELVGGIARAGAPTRIIGPDQPLGEPSCESAKKACTS